VSFGAYSLGANNIANVMGFYRGNQSPPLDFGIIQFDSTQQLFFIGGVAIAIGIITYSRHVMETVGNTLMPLTPEAAIVVMLSQALVLFIFSSQGLSNAFQSIGLPAIPLVPVSSSQIVIGSIIGIGIYKGGKEIKYNILGSISLGWIATPIVAGIMVFFMLFFVNNVFKLDVGGNRTFVTNTEMLPQNEIIIADSTIQLQDSVISQSDTFIVSSSIEEKEYHILTHKSNSILLLIAIVALLIAVLVLLYNLKTEEQ